MDKTASCLCGTVSLEIKDAPDTTGACHCGMCRKWSGGVYLGVHCHADQVAISGKDNITTFASSDWAERAFCKTCGSNLYYRVTAPGPHHGDLHIGLGLFDDPGEINLTEEIFIDKKPAGYAFANDTNKMTEAEVIAMFAPPD